MSKKLYASITGITKPISISVSSAYTNASDVAIIKAESTTLSIGDAITVDMGYTDDHAILFTGYVKRVERVYPDNVYTVTAYDVMTRAVDYFIASTNPNAPFKRSKIAAETLIGEVLALAGLTNYQGDATNFIYGWTVPVEVNLIGAYDFCKQLSDLVAWHLYADVNGKIWFVDRKPYAEVGDTPTYTLNENKIITATRSDSDDDLRNRIVVYGNNGVFAEAKASSPYLPSGYYKTAVMSATFVDQQWVADDAASYNLSKWNRLRNSYNISALGNTNITARKIITVETTPIATQDDWFVYSVEHLLGTSGYTTNMELRI